MIQNNSLAFNNIPLEIINDDSGLWIRGYQIGSALGYTQPLQKIINLHERNADEFSPSMTRMMKLKTSGGIQNTRVFSLRGVHLLAMFAKTPKAKEFRKWVLDVLENHAEEKQSLSGMTSEDMDTLHASKEAMEFLLDRLTLHKQMIETQSMTASRNEDTYASILAEMRDKIGNDIAEMLKKVYKGMQSVLGDHPDPLSVIKPFLARA